MTRNEPSRSVVCTIDEARIPERASHVREQLLPQYLGADEYDTGVRLRFDGTDETLQAVARFVSNELQCCSFAEYDIDVSPPYEETRLTITGPAGTRELFMDGLVHRFEAAPEPE